MDLSQRDVTHSFDEKKYGGLIFDCDGTLTHSMPLHFIAWRDTLNRHGITFTEERFYALGGMPNGKIISLLSEEQSVEVDHDQISEEKENSFLENLHQLTRIEIVCELAKRHQNRTPISVASGGERRIVTTQLKTIKMDSVFSIVVCAEDTELHKPNPDVFLEAAKRMKVPANQCCVFEDSLLGMQAAVRADMDFIDIRKWL